MNDVALAERDLAEPQQAGGQLAGETYQRLRDLIVKGRLTPGSRLAEAPLAAALGVSRTPIRSAIQRLAQEGYILVSSPLSPSGPIVAPLLREDAREVFEIIGKLESLVARRAAALPAPQREALADRLASINAELRRTAAEGPEQQSRLHDLHGDFHRTLVAGAGGDRTRQLHDGMNAQAERYERVYSGFVSATEESAREHDALIGALRLGDAAAAEAAAERNWIASAERLVQVIGRAMEFGGW
jgi:DNA-binding GntR family transcriptional regulator